MKKNKKDQLLILSVLFMLIGWGVYFYKFNEVYQFIDLLTNSNLTAVIKLTYVLTYYSDLLVPYVLIGFGLLNMNLLLALISYFIYAGESKLKSIALWVSSGIFIIASSVFMFTSIYPLMLILIVISLIIAYVLYTVYKKTYEEDTNNYEQNEVIKEAGPFAEKEDAKVFFEEFSLQWKSTFEKLDLTLIPQVTRVDEEKYHLDIRVRYK